MGISGVTAHKAVSWQEFHSWANELADKSQGLAKVAVRPADENSIILAFLVAKRLDLPFFHGIGCEDGFTVSLTNDKWCDACIIFYDHDRYGAESVTTQVTLFDEIVEVDTQRRTTYAWPWQ